MKVDLKLSVPDSLHDITLGQYQKYVKIAEPIEDDTDEANDFLNKKIIEIFCDVSLKEVDSIPVVEVDKVTSIITNAFKEKFSLIRRFKLLDVDMGFIPNLHQMSLGEYVDVENNIVDWQNMHKAMAVLYRPVNFSQRDKYGIAPYNPSEEVSHLMKEMPLSVVMSSMVFFYDLGMELSKATLNYLEFLTKKEKGKSSSRLKHHLEQNGVGINQFMDSLKVMSSNLTMLQNKTSISV